MSTALARNILAVLLDRDQMTVDVGFSVLEEGSCWGESLHKVMQWQRAQLVRIVMTYPKVDNPGEARKDTVHV